MERTQPFPDAGVAFDLQGWKRFPTPPGEPLLLQHPSAPAATLQLAELGFPGVTDGEVLARLGLAALEQTARRFDEVTRPLEPIALSGGLRGATVGGRAQGLRVRVWAINAGTAVVLVSFIVPGEDVSLAEAVVRSAVPAPAEVAPPPRLISRATALLRWVTAEQRARAPDAVYEPVAGELGLSFALPRLAGLTLPVNEAHLQAEGVSRGDFRAWALESVDVAALDIGPEGPLVMNRKPAHNAALALLTAQGRALVEALLSERFLVMVPSQAGFMAAPDTPEGRAVLSKAAAQLVLNQAVDVSTLVLRVERGAWSVA